MALHLKRITHFKFSLIVLLMLTIILMADSTLPGDANRVEIVLTGNDITTSMNNTGSFSRPGNTTTDMVWHNLGYSYEINFFVGAEVPVPQGSHPDAFNAHGQWMAHVISDGLLTDGGDWSPDYSMRWSWQPIPLTSDGALTIFDEGNPQIPSRLDSDLNGDGWIDSWPHTWWDDQKGKQVWPSLWPGDTLIKGPEYLFSMDDRFNKEFEYYPFPLDSTRKGLGVEVTSRTIAYTTSDVRNALITIYDIHNISAYDLDSVKAGLWGDPHIGGESDWQDDRIIYDKASQMVICSDDDSKSLTDPSIVPGLMGIVFLQTPGNPVDGIDNDGDGMTDESMYDGIDNDGDWQAKWDDVGADGIANTSDTGEGDGIATLGEPHFEFTDMDEADMCGLQSLSTPSFASIYISDDEQIWQLLKPGEFDSLTAPGDNVLLPGSGLFPLKASETKRMAVAFIFGQNRDELIHNAQKARRYYAQHLGNFQIERPFLISLNDTTRYYTAPFNVNWDAAALENVDSLQLYYSVNNGKSWTQYGSNFPNTGVYTMETDGMLNSAFYKVRLLSVDGSVNYAAESDSFFTIDNSGEANVAPEIIWDLPDGLVLNNQANITWQEADVDQDVLTRKITISSKVVNDTLFPTGPSYNLATISYPNGKYKLTVILSDPASSTSVSHNIEINNTNNNVSDSFIDHIAGYADGTVHAVFPDQNSLHDNIYYITFNRDNDGTTTYSVMDSLNHKQFVQNDPLPLSPEYGRYFDGLSLTFKNSVYGFNEENSGWNPGRANNLTTTVIREHGYPEVLSDYEVHFVEGIGDTSVNNNITAPFYILAKHTQTRMDFAILENHETKNGQWDTGETILILYGGTSSANIVWRVVFSYPALTDPVPAVPGDIYNISVHKPFSETDTYSINTTILGIGSNASAPGQYILENNYPNPFNPLTTIAYQLSKASAVRLEIFDILGRKVRTLVDGKQISGRHTVLFNAKQLASGVYVYVLWAGTDFVQSKKLILLK